MLPACLQMCRHIRGYWRATIAAIRFLVQLHMHWRRSPQLSFFLWIIEVTLWCCILQVKSCCPPTLIWRRSLEAWSLQNGLSAKPIIASLFEFAEKRHIWYWSNRKVMEEFGTQKASFLKVYWTTEYWNCFSQAVQPTPPTLSFCRRIDKPQTTSTSLCC